MHERYEVRAIEIRNNKAYLESTYDDFKDLEKAREQINIWRNHYKLNICYYEILEYKLGDSDNKTLVERKLITERLY